MAMTTLSKAVGFPRCSNGYEDGSVLPSVPAIIVPSVLRTDGWKVKGWSGDEGQTDGYAPGDAGRLGEPASAGCDRVPQGGEQDPARETKITGELHRPRPIVEASKTWGE
jgi:hypothetical protein